MAEIRAPKRRENQKSPTTTPPATATTSPLPPSTSAPVTSPTSSFSKCVSLFDWWLIRAERESQSTGKRLGIAGFTAHGGKLESRVFTSAPIVVRHDAYTVETADGITVRIEGCIDQSLSVINGFSPEVCRRFLIGFPYNWEYYADGDVGNNKSILIHSDVFSVRKTSDVLSSSPDHSIDDVLKRHFTSTSGKVRVWKNVVDKIKQNCEYIGRSTQIINRDVEGNATSDASRRGFDMVGLNGERSVVNDKVRRNPNVPLDASLAKSDKGKNLAMFDSDALNFETVSQLRHNDEIITDKTDLTIEGVSYDILPNENHSLQLQQCNEQMSAQKTRGNGGHGSDDVQVREDSRRKDTCCTPSKMKFPLEDSFSPPSNVTQRNEDDKSIPTSSKVASVCSSARQSTLTSPQHWRRLRGYAGSGRRPERIRVDNIGESNDNHSINTANPSADSITNYLLPKENDVSHKDEGTVLGGYALRSGNPVIKIGVDKTCSSEGILGGEDSEKANSDLLMVEMNVSLEPLIASDFRNSYHIANLRNKGKDSQKSDTRFTISCKNEIAVPLSCPVSLAKSTGILKGITSNKVDQIDHNIRTKLEDDLLSVKDCSLTMDTVDVTKTRTSELIEYNVRNSHQASKLKDESRDAKNSDTRFTVSSKNESAVLLSCPISPDKSTEAFKGITTNKVDEIYVNIRQKFEDNFLSVKDCSSMMDTVDVTKSKTSEVRETLQRKQALSNLKYNQKDDQGAHGHAIEMIEEVSGVVNKFEDDIKEKNPFPGTKDLNSGSTSQNAVYMSNTRSGQREISDSSACKSQCVNEDLHFSCKRGTQMLEIPTLDRGSEAENEHSLETVDHNCTNVSADFSQIGTIKGAPVSSNRRCRNENESPEVLLIEKKVRKLRRNQESDALTEAQPTEDKTMNARRQNTVWRPSYPHAPQYPLTRALAKKFSVTLPTLLDLERPRSG